MAIYTLGLTGPVHSDTPPTADCNITELAGWVTVSNRTLTAKLGGLQCQTQDRSTLEVHGDGVDNTNFDIAIAPVASSVWDNSKKVDDATSSLKDVLFGPGGQVGTSAIIDGSDYDGSTNGEVTFGGTQAGQGASRLYMRTDFTNYDIQPTTDTETLTFTFTPQ